MFQLPPGMNYKQFQAAGSPGYRSDVLPFKEGGYTNSAGGSVRQPSRYGYEQPPGVQPKAPSMPRYDQAQPMQPQGRGTPYPGGPLGMLAPDAAPGTRDTLPGPAWGQPPSQGTPYGADTPQQPFDQNRWQMGGRPTGTPQSQPSQPSAYAHPGPQPMGPDGGPWRTGGRTPRPDQTGQSFIRHNFAGNQPSFNGGTWGSQPGGNFSPFGGSPWGSPQGGFGGGTPWGDAMRPGPRPENNPFAILLSAPPGAGQQPSAPAGQGLRVDPVTRKASVPPPTAQPQSAPPAETWRNSKTGRTATGDVFTIGPSMEFTPRATAEDRRRAYENWAAKEGWVRDAAPSPQGGFAGGAPGGQIPFGGSQPWSPWGGTPWGSPPTGNSNPYGGTQPLRDPNLKYH